MEFFPLITLLITIFLFFMLPSCANSQQILVKSPEDQQDHQLQLTLLPALPRKLRLIREVKAVETRTRVLQNKQEESLSSGKFQQKGGDLVHAKKGTWQEWKEGADNSHFFSMDYSHVRRRRPIHNKFTPVSP